MSEPLPEKPTRRIVMYARHGEPGVWAVEDYDEDGGCALTVFSGLAAKARAERYFRELRAADERTVA